MSQKTPPGRIVWTDLTIENADEIRDFYRQVIGWQVSLVEMDGYNDYNMFPAGSENPAAGICHARGMNANLPAQWLIYITVENLEESLARCEAMGGKVLVRHATTPMAVVQDPAGAIFALYAP